MRFLRLSILAAAAMALHGQDPPFEVAAIQPSHSASDESNFDSTKGGRLAQRRFRRLPRC